MNLREKSRTEWESNESIESVNAGSLQRIADACEKMAASYDTVRKERDKYYGWWREEIAKVSAREKQITALRGVITKLKKARTEEAA